MGRQYSEPESSMEYYTLTEPNEVMYNTTTWYPELQDQIDGPNNLGKQVGNSTISYKKQKMEEELLNLEITAVKADSNYNFKREQYQQRYG